jgi:large subunit ribosomal protein L13
MGVRTHRATQSARPEEVERHWYVADATDQVLGRLASRVATILKGKHKPIFTPHVDTGDFVIVVNAEKVRLTGNKRQTKIYHRHSGWAGALRSVTAAKVLAGPHSDRVVRDAVRGMLPKNSLGRKMLGKLKVYAGPHHRHAAQKPEELQLD